MKKIYIAGKISGLPIKETIIKFAEAYTKIESLNFEPVNPIEIVQNAMVVEHSLLSLDDEALWKEAMKICIKQLVDCDGLVLLADWQESRGAKIEQQLADSLDIPIFNYTKFGLSVLVGNLG